MMNTTATANCKNCWLIVLCRSRLERQWKWQLPYGDCALPMAGSSIVTNPVAHGDHYACARALCTLLLLQAAPLKCVLAQTRHRVPNSRACPSRCANETICTHHSNMLTKRTICFVRLFLQLKKPLLGPKRFAK